MCSLVERAIIVEEPSFKFNVPVAEKSWEPDQQNIIDNVQCELPSNLTETLNGFKDALSLLGQDGVANLVQDLLSCRCFHRIVKIIDLKSRIETYIGIYNLK
jgi:hypothetical protein